MANTTVTYSSYMKLSNFFSSQASKNSLYTSVVFYVTPEINESRNVSYYELSDIRLPASILIYMGSPSRQFTLNAKFIARSQAEAEVSFRNKSILESWCVTNSALGNINSATSKVGAQITSITGVQTASPDATDPNDISKTIAQDAGNQQILPPAFSSGTNIFSQSPSVLALEGYGGQFRKIPVVIQSLNITYPSDTDYVKTAAGQLVPIIQDVSISLKEAREISGFNGAIAGFKLDQFRTGQLQFW